MRPLGAPPWKWRHRKGSDRHWHSEPISFKKCNPLEPSEQMTTGPILLQLLGFPPRTLQRYPTPFYKCTIFRQIRLWRPSSSQDQPPLCRAKGSGGALGTAPKSPSFVNTHFGDPRARWINHLLAVPRRPTALSQHRPKFTIFRHIALRRFPSGLWDPPSLCRAKGSGGALSTAPKNSPSFVKLCFGDLALDRSALPWPCPRVGRCPQHRHKTTIFRQMALRRSPNSPDTPSPGLAKGPDGALSTAPNAPSFAAPLSPSLPKRPWVKISGS